MLTRRQFSVSLGACFGALATGRIVLPEPKPRIDLAPFCDPEPMGRYDLSKPFEQAGLTYATDGRIMLRVEDPLEVQPGEKLKYPNCQELPWDAFKRGEWDRWPENLLAPKMV